MKLEPLTLEQCEQVRIWRNAEMECWRTPFMLTREMQEDFYKRCCDRNSPHRYWAINCTGNDDLISRMGDKFIGMGGITYIQWENRIGEITLIIDPAQRKDGLGEQAVDLLLDQAFNYLNLQTVFGECYTCNEAWGFWIATVDKYMGYRTNLPRRKYYNSKYWDSLYFSINKDDFNKIYNSKQPEDQSW
jgi:RimJ/RimL family protein N-acetyltransferase